MIHLPLLLCSFGRADATENVTCQDEFSLLLSSNKIFFNPLGLPLLLVPLVYLNILSAIGQGIQSED